MTMMVTPHIFGRGPWPWATHGFEQGLGTQDENNPCVDEWGDTVDGQNPAPPKKPWNDDSSVNTNK